MRADMLVEILKTLPQIQVVIDGKSLGVGVETKRAQTSAKSGHLQIKLFRVAAFRRAKMPQHREAGIDRVHKPETRDFLRGEFCHATPAAACAGKRRAL